MTSLKQEREAGLWMRMEEEKAQKLKEDEVCGELWPVGSCFPATRK
jgi:hypothetical protein